jgi:hypothetical protein
VSDGIVSAIREDGNKKWIQTITPTDASLSLGMTACWEVSISTPSGQLSQVSTWGEWPSLMRLSCRGVRNDALLTKNGDGRLAVADFFVQSGLV